MGLERFAHITVTIVIRRDVDGAMICEKAQRSKCLGSTTLYLIKKIVTHMRAQKQIYQNNNIPVQAIVHTTQENITT